MPQDAFTIKYITKELSCELVGGKISKITQPDKDTLTFIIYTKNHSVKLDICLSAKYCRVSLTKSEVPAPKVAPNFCMLLRKHLQNAEIVNVFQPDFERIIVFDFICTSEFDRTNMRLYAEIMGKYSNLILVENEIIVGALKSNFLSETTKRLTFSGVKYTPPEPQDKLSYTDILAIGREIGNYSDKAQFISDRIKGIAFTTALDMVETFGESITAKDIYSYIEGGDLSPCVKILEREPQDFLVRSAKAQMPFGSLLEAQEYYYDFVTSKHTFEEAKRKLLSTLSGELKKCRKRLAVIEQKLLDCKDAELTKLKGELITSNIYLLKQGMESVEVVNYYDEEGGTIKIALDKNLTPSKNAQKYFKRYQKLKRTILSVSEQKTKEASYLDYLESIESHISLAERVEDLSEIREELITLGLIKEAPIKNKKPVITPFREYEVEGYRIISGRNNLQNDRLVKELSAEDMWLHTHAYHSSHVGIFSQCGDIPESVLLAAAEICAYYSEGRQGNKIPVDYAKKKFVKKPKGRASGFVNYTDYSTILCDPNKHEELRHEEKRK